MLLLGNPIAGATGGILLDEAIDARLPLGKLLVGAAPKGKVLQIVVTAPPDLQRISSNNRVLAGRRLGDIIEENAALEQQGRPLLGAGQGRRGHAGPNGLLLLENRASLANLANGARLSGVMLDNLFAAEDNLFKQKDVVFAVNVGLGNDKNVVEEQIAKVGEMMAFPIFDTRLEGLDRVAVLDLALCLIGLIGNALGDGNALLELVIVGVCVLVGAFEKVL